MYLLYLWTIYGCCLWAATSSFGNEAQELEVCVPWSGWDHRDFGTAQAGVAMAGIRLCGKDRLRRWGGGVAQYVRKQQDCEELCLGQTGSQWELWGQDYRAGEHSWCGGGVCWGLPAQGKPFSGCFTSTCPGPCEKLRPPLDGMKGDTAGHKSTGMWSQCHWDWSLQQGGSWQEREGLGQQTVECLFI